jgi:adenylyltransferase/sulfurtransferase
MGDLSPRLYYDRQLRVPGWGPAGQEKLGRSTVIVVGVGGLGCPALSALARSGVGRLVFCDPDSVEASNLPRQTLFAPADVGRPKVEAARDALSVANPWIRLEPRAVRVDASNVRALVEDADLVIEGTDNFASKFLVHDACRSAGKPLVLASLYQWEAQVMAFPFDKPGPGCWRCLWPTAPEDGCVGVCADVGVAGALAGVAGNFQALAALRLLLGLAGPQPCSTWMIDAADWSPQTLRWKPRTDCACARGHGDWSWLAPLAGAAGVRREAAWPDIAADERQVVVDVREPSELESGEWEFFRQAGSEVVHYPWTRWSQKSPSWSADRTYLLVCAHGIRSRAALGAVPPGVRALSLAGGVAALGPSLNALRAR